MIINRTREVNVFSPPLRVMISHFSGVQTMTYEKNNILKIFTNLISINGKPRVLYET